MNVGIIIECSDIYNITIVKTIYDKADGLQAQFWDLIIQHLRSVPEVLEDSKLFYARKEYNKQAFPDLPIAKTEIEEWKGSWKAPEYQDKYGKWKLIII